MRLTNLLFTTLLLFVSVFARSQKSNEFTVLQWNVWQEGTMVPGGYDAIVNEIVRLKPDFVTFSEVRNYNKTNFTARVCASLKEKGLSYYSFYLMHERVPQAELFLTPGVMPGLLSHCWRSQACLFPPQLLL